VDTSLACSQRQSLTYLVSLSITSGIHHIFISTNNIMSAFPTAIFEFLMTLTRVLSCNMWCHVIWYKFSSVSEEHWSTTARRHGIMSQKHCTCHHPKKCLVPTNKEDINDVLYWS
jgi:hypothetical protein